MPHSHNTYAYHSLAPFTLHFPHADQADQCDKDSFAIVTASLVNDVHSLLSSLSGAPQHLPTPQISPKAVDAMKSVNTDSIVLVSHSAGAVTAVDMLAGKRQAPPLLLSFCCLHD